MTSKVSLREVGLVLTISAVSALLDTIIFKRFMGPAFMVGAIYCIYMGVVERPRREGV